MNRFFSSCFPCTGEHFSSLSLFVIYLSLCFTTRDLVYPRLVSYIYKASHPCSSLLTRLSYLSVLDFQFLWPCPSPPRQSAPPPQTRTADIFGAGKVVTFPRHTHALLLVSSIFQAFILLLDAGATACGGRPASEAGSERAPDRKRCLRCHSKDTLYPFVAGSRHLCYRTKLASLASTKTASSTELLKMLWKEVGVCWIPDERERESYLLQTWSSEKAFGVVLELRIRRDNACSRVHVVRRVLTYSLGIFSSCPWNCIFNGNSENATWLECRLRGACSE